MNGLTLVDSHCHLDFPELANQTTEILQRMRQAQVGWALIAGVTLERFPVVLDIAQQERNIFAAVGVHPDTVVDAQNREADEEELVRLAQENKVVAIGETGLDYYRLEVSTERADANITAQKQRFIAHINAARRSGLPLIIHCRSAATDTLQLLREHQAEKVGGVFHCFTEDMATAEAVLELGFYISFSGILTFKNAKALKEVAKRVPLSRVLVETDAPYLAPTPHRGQLNEPAYVRFVARELAALKGLSEERIAEETTENFFRLFARAER